MRHLILPMFFLLLGHPQLMAAGDPPEQPQHAIEPLKIPGRAHQFYLGFLETLYNYSVRSGVSSPAFRLTSNGLNAEYELHQWDHFSLVNTLRYGSGGQLQQSLGTAAAGLRYGLYYRQFEPFAQLLAGYSRLTSDHPAGNLFLGNGTNQSFTILAAAGLDVTLSKHWGIRPFYVESQYLPSIGPGQSIYWSFGGGVLYRFGHGHGN